MMHQIHEAEASHFTDLAWSSSYFKIITRCFIITAIVGQMFSPLATTAAVYDDSRHHCRWCDEQQPQNEITFHPYTSLALDSNCSWQTRALTNVSNLNGTMKNWDFWKSDASVPTKNSSKRVGESLAEIETHSPAEPARLLISSRALATATHCETSANVFFSFLV